LVKVQKWYLFASTESEFCTNTTDPALLHIFGHSSKEIQNEGHLICKRCHKIGFECKSKALNKTNKINFFDIKTTITLFWKYQKVCILHVSHHESNIDIKVSQLFIILYLMNNNNNINKQWYVLCICNSIQLIDHTNYVTCFSHCFLFNNIIHIMIVTETKHIFR
jgi:hypothetical protein